MTVDLHLCSDIRGSSFDNFWVLEVAFFLSLAILAWRLRVLEFNLEALAQCVHLVVNLLQIADVPGSFFWLFPLGWISLPAVFTAQSLYVQLLKLPEALINSFSYSLEFPIDSLLVGVFVDPERLFLTKVITLRTMVWGVTVSNKFLIKVPVVSTVKDSLGFYGLEMHRVLVFSALREFPLLDGV